MTSVARSWRRRRQQSLEPTGASSTDPYSCSCSSPVYASTLHALISFSVPSTMESVQTKIWLSPMDWWHNFSTHRILASSSPVTPAPTQLMPFLKVGAETEKFILVFELHSLHHLTQSTLMAIDKNLEGVLFGEWPDNFPVGYGASACSSSPRSSPPTRLILNAMPSLQTFRLALKNSSGEAEEGWG